MGIEDNGNNECILHNLMNKWINKYVITNGWKLNVSKN